MNNKFTRRFNNKPAGKFYFINQRIQEEQLRVINHDGTLVGVLSRQDALNEAAQQGLDLVLVAQSAKPPVAKITDFKKFLYEQGKKDKEAKKGAKKSVVKDIQISLFIGQADLDRLIEKTKDFILEGNQVRLNLTLRGREVTKKDKALELTNNFISNLGEVTIAKEPRLEGRVVRAVITKKK